jgi:SSS family solute:Na+ symporter/sodium/pantothenate symporter
MTFESLQVLFAFACYLVGVAALGIYAHRYLSKGDFVKEYFIGNRGLGAWVLALTVAATAISGGSFVGFPALIYRNGWIMALWIAGYTVVPLLAMVLMGKRINQVARLSGAVTVPDVLRDRFRMPVLGILASLFILFFLIFNMVSQFKAGGKVLAEAMQLPPVEVHFFWINHPVDLGYLIGLVVFALTVVAYTTYGGFWAVAWTDVLEGTVKFVGVLVMAYLALSAVPPIQSSDGTQLTGLAAATEHLARQKPDGDLISGPGPSGFLGVGLAFSFFLVWTLNSPGVPASMVRLMSFKDTQSLRKAVAVVAIYYVLTYISLLVIFVCARAIFPTEYLDDPDRIMPVMTRRLAHPLVAGLLLAGPYAAVMSAVAAFLLMISSSLVRDLYQRTINPQASPKTLRRASYWATALVGAIVLVGAINPPRFLQYIIVFTGTGQGCAFFVPMMLALYWKRVTGPGVLAGMLGGFIAVTGLYALGWADSWAQGTPGTLADGLNAVFGWLPGWGEKRLDGFAPVYLCGLDPIIWGTLAAGLSAVAFSLATKPDEELTRKYFP